MRTREQIVADCEKRFEEMRREAEKPQNKYRCETCRFFSTRGSDGFKWGRDYPDYHTCIEPLVKGITDEWGVQLGMRRDRFPSPCGPEKALWQPKLTLCQRIIQFLFGEQQP